MTNSDTYSSQTNPSQTSGDRASTSAEVPFVAALREHCKDLQRALWDLVSESMGGMAQSGADVRHALSVDRKLACQLFDAIRAPDAFEFASCLPSFRRLSVAATAAERARVSKPVIEAYAKAISRMEQFVADQAGPRWKFDAIVWNLKEGRVDDSHTEIDLRRAAMQAAARDFGSTINTVATVTLIGPHRSANDRFDLAWLHARLGICRLKPHLKIPVTGRRFRTSDAVGREPVSVAPPRPIFPEPQGSPPGAHLVPGRCSPLVPPLRVSTTPSGITAVELGGDDVGAASACDLISASINDEAVPTKAAPDEPTNRYTFTHRVRHACERHLIIVGYPVGIVSDQPPICTMQSIQYPEFAARDSTNLRSLTPDVLPGNDCLRTLELPRISDPLEDVFARLDWDPAMYTFFVLDEKYPLALSTIKTSIMLGASENKTGSTAL